MDNNNYQWYPGHMAKAFKIMKEDIALVDIVIEVVDARAPESTRNPNLLDLQRARDIFLYLISLIWRMIRKAQCGSIIIKKMVYVPFY